jgi:hypothetical protein
LGRIAAPGGTTFDQICNLSNETDGMRHRLIMKPESTTNDLGDSIEISAFM